MKRFFLLFLLGQTLFAVAAEDDLFSKADAAFRGGRFEEARDFYSQIAQTADPRSAAFYYNYGTVLIKVGDLGEAHAYLLKAASLDPLDGDIRNNLNFARNNLSAGAKNVAPTGVLSSMTPFYLPQGLWLSLAMASSALFFLFFVWRRGAPFFRGLVFLMAFAAGLGSLYSALVSSASLVVVSAKEAKLRSGPSPGFPEIMALEPGSLVKLAEKHEGWAKIEFVLKSEKNREMVGWIDAKSLIPISGQGAFP